MQFWETYHYSLSAKLSWIKRRELSLRWYERITDCFMKKWSKVISVWLSKDSSTLLRSLWKKLSKLIWKSSTLIFIETSRRIPLSHQAVHLNHLYCFQTSQYFNRLKNLTSILTCNRRVLNDLNELLNRFLKNLILKNLELSRRQISSWRIKEKTMNLLTSKMRLSVWNNYSNWLLNIVMIVYNNQRTIIN